MKIELLWPAITILALLVTQWVKKVVRPSYWQTKTGKQVLRLVPVAFGSLACALLSVAGVVNAASLDVDALLGAGMGATAIALFHGGRVASK